MPSGTNNVWAPREVDIDDAISVEYLHNKLINGARKEKSLKDSIENVEKKVDQERINKTKKNDVKYKNNI